MKLIELNKGQVCIVDDEDFEKLAQYRWNCSGQYATRAVIKNGKSTTEYMHRVIMGESEKWIQVDHINGNGLDNRRRNLRFSTMSQQRMNQGIQKNNTSGFRGVFWDKTTNGWKARIKIHRKNKYLGQFKTADEANKAYEKAAEQLFGEHRRVIQFKAA